jgi:carboxymethylenebutenolidase
LTVSLSIVSVAAQPAETSPLDALPSLGSNAAADPFSDLNLRPVGPPRTETEYIAQPPTLIPERKPEYATVEQAVHVRREGVALLGWLARPDATTPTAAVLLIPGVNGLTDAIRIETKNLARLGAAALAIDPFGGDPPANRRAAFRAYAGLDRQKTLELIDHGRHWLAETAGLDVARIGLVGYGLGADWALAGAGWVPPPALVALFYGGVTTNGARLAAIRAPLIGFYARHDGFLSAERIAAFEAALEQAGIDHQVFSYDAKPVFQLEPATRQDEAYAETARERIVERLTENR